MKHKIAVLAGDGIGPEVMDASLKVLDRAAESFGFSVEYRRALIGGAAIDERGRALPEESIDICRSCDAVLLGSVGGPKWDKLPADQRPERAGLLALRKELSLYANLRPVRVYPAIRELSPLKNELLEGGVDLLTVRELSSGIYFSEPKAHNSDEGYDTMRYRRPTVQRIAETAFDLARQRRGRLTSVDKSNVLYSSILWRETVEEVSRNYPDVELEHMYVDNAAMQMIINPGRFDVILTGNLFGDILSDESAALPGSLGLLPSASLGPKQHLYEPSGGSAPDIAGKGVANPLAQILSIAMMCDYSLEQKEAARAIYRAVERSIEKRVLSADLLRRGKASSTEKVAEAVASEI